MLKLGDCLVAMKKMPDNSVDCIITDPPAGISFMGKEWDTHDDLNAFQNFIKDIFTEAKRVLKPGGHACVWAIPRTSHHTAMGLERAGYEIRDIIHHTFSSGFPKSHNIGKSIDKMKGWGSALKPAVEHWILCRKPLEEKTIASNVLKYGTGGINIDDCRIPYADSNDKPIGGFGGMAIGIGQPLETQEYSGSNECNKQGRFPANLIVSDNVLDNGKEIKSVGGVYKKNKSDKESDIFNQLGDASYLQKNNICTAIGDKGQYSRYFSLERWAEEHKISEVENTYPFLIIPKASKKDKGKDNRHPTVKSTKLMSYLISLLCPKDGVVLDCFMGSGTTGVAAVKLQRRFIGIEKDSDYYKIAKARIESWNK